MLKIVDVTILPGGRMRAKDAAAYIGMTSNTLRKKRSDGIGPPFYKTKDGTIYYLKKDLDTYITGGGKQNKAHTKLHQEELP